MLSVWDHPYALNVGINLESSKCGWSEMRGCGGGGYGGDSKHCERETGFGALGRLLARDPLRRSPSVMPSALGPSERRPLRG